MADFEWFRSFIAIYRHGSISSAAAKRFMTQPALSQHLAALESEIGEPLFYRTPRKMVPTDRGKSLYAQIVQAVDQLEVTNAQFLHSKASPVLRIGGPVEFMHEQLVQTLPPSAYTYSMVFGKTRSLLTSLKAHEIDVLIATQHIAAHGLVYRELFTERFLLVGSRQERDVIDADEKNAMQALQLKRWIAYSSELPIIRRYWLEVFGQRATIEPKFIVPDLRTIKRLVMLGEGVSVLPDYLVRRELERGTLKPLWISEQHVSNQIWLVYRSSDRENPLLMDWIEHALHSNRPSPDEKPIPQLETRN